MFDLKSNLFKYIKLERNSFQKNNVKTICKTCLLKIIEYHQIIEYFDVLFKVKPIEKKIEEYKNNKKESTLSLKFKIVQIGKNN